LAQEEDEMDQLPAILQRLVAINELTVYALIFLGLLTFLGLVVTVIGLYRTSVQHRETLQVLDRMGYYLFKKLGPAELP
jgi:hypothetical protein